MESDIWKRLFYFAVAVLISIFFFWFGLRLVSANSYTLNSTQLVFMGLLILICAVMLTGSYIQKFWRHALLLVLLAIYSFARSTGHFAQPWLAWMLGISSWLAALIILYIAWPTRDGLFHNEE